MRAPKPRSSSTTLTAEDWARAALEALGEGGLAAVAIEPLARALGVTKGSFYWHFRSRRGLLLAALRRWERSQTEAVIASVAGVGDPRERLERLFRAASAGDGRLELSVSAAAQDPRVAPILRRVSARRLAYLEECYRRLGLAPVEAWHRSLLAYSAYVGFLHVVREAHGRLRSGRDVEAYRRHVVAALVPPPRPRRRGAVHG